MMTETNNKKNSSAILAITILLISILQNYISIVSPAMDKIRLAFPMQPETMIAMVLTIYAIGFIPSTLIAGLLTRKFSEKAIILFGFTVLIIAGFLPAIISNFYIILTLRFIAGFGCGLVAPFQTSLFPKYFDKERASFFIGIQTAACQLFAIIFGAVSGWLARVSWSYPFYIYLVGIFAFLAVLIWLPNEKDSKEIIEVPKTKFVFNKEMVLLLSLSFVYHVALFSFNLEISYYIAHYGIGDTIITGYANSFFSIGSVITGLIFLQIRKKIGSLLLPISIATLSMGFFTIVIAHSTTLTLIGSLMMGISVGLFMPTVYNLSIELYKDSNVSMATALVLCVMSIGQFATPYFTTLIRSIFNVSYQGTFIVCGITALILCFTQLKTVQKTK